MIYTLSNTNGWTVTKQVNGTGLLHIIANPKASGLGQIFQKEHFVTLNPEIMTAIEKGMTNINDLAINHKIYTWILIDAPDKIAVTEILPNNPKINTENCYQGKDYFVTHEGDKYYLEYRLARQGDGSRKFEISKEIYEYARQDIISSSDIFRKYKLYHLDVPENDVK